MQHNYAAGLEGLKFLDLDFGADTQGTQYEFNDFTLPSQTQFSQTQVRSIVSVALPYRAQLTLLTGFTG